MLVALVCHHVRYLSLRSLKEWMITRLRGLAVKSGEFCVCKLIEFTYLGQIGAIHTQVITKPGISPSMLTGNRDQD